MQKYNVPLEGFMKEDKSYQWQLKKMLIIEIIGERIYKILSSKAKNDNRREIYQRLALNEKLTAQYIEKELLLINKSNHIILKGIISSLASFIFNLLTAKQIVWILEKTLKKRIYSHWLNIYKEYDQEFWNQLVNHEKLQHELLGF